MMSSAYGAAMPASVPSGYQPEYMLDDWSRQMLATSSARRFSRGSNGQRSGIGSMRVAKPTSASNSPRSSIHATSRRRTMVNEGMGMQSRIRQQQFMDQAFMSAATGEPSHNAFLDPVNRPSRPVSWHPGTQLQQQQHQFPATQHQQYSEPQLPEATAAASSATYPIGPLPNYPQYSPVLAAYSCQTSPVAYSPLTLPFAEYQQTPSCLPIDDWTAQAQPVPITTATTSQPDSQPVTTTLELFPSPTAPVTSTSSNQELDWNTFAAHGFNMSPPTPDSFPPAPPAEPVVSSEDSIPFQPLEEEEEEEGEILIGMGLYDTPGKEVADTGLENYRTTTSHLLGTATGKGLKLLEAWEPPASDDEDENEDENDDDEDEGIKVGNNE